MLPSNNGLRHSEQYLLYIRLLYSLLTLIVCTVVSQVALLPSYNSKATVSSLCSLPVPIYPNLFEFILNLFAFFIEERMLTNACKALAKYWVSRHHSHVLLAYIYNTFRSELYQGLQDTAMHDRHNGEDVRFLGHKLIFFSSHMRSPRFMT